MTILNGTFATVLIFGVGGAVGIGAGVALGFVIQSLLVLTARRDEQAMDVYRRHIHHQRFFPASASPDAAQQPPRA